MKKTDLQTSDVKQLATGFQFVEGPIWDHDGHWLFGRKHGPGAYDFVSGAKYEGKWSSGKMVGIGWYTKDGKRNLVDNRKKS